MNPSTIDARDVKEVYARFYPEHAGHRLDSITLPAEGDVVLVACRCGFLASIAEEAVRTVAEEARR